MKYLLDENLPFWLAGDLRTAGIDAADVREISRPGLADDAVYRLALRNKRHLVSANYKDFGNPLLFPPTKSTGIIIIRMPRCSVRTVAALVGGFLKGAKESEVSGYLIVLEPTRVRRSRPR